jgi:hypothetical protein
VLLPTPLKAFTDVMPDVKAMLRACASVVYSWRCDHDDLPEMDVEAWTSHAAYPSTWPTSVAAGAPLGMVMVTPAIAADADKRLAAIRHDLEHAGPFYPRHQVRAALTYWGIDH